LRTVEVARDAPLLAPHGERVTLAGREHEEGPVAVLRDGLDIPARRGKQESPGEQGARNATLRRHPRLHLANCNAKPPPRPRAAPPRSFRPACHNPGRMTWWESWFGEEYLELYPHRDLASARREVAFALARLDPEPM